jgi:uncharacterized protein DUF547
MTRMRARYVGLMLLLSPAPVWAGETAPTVFDNAPYAAVLRAHVNGDGQVDYVGLKARRAVLDEFVAALGRLDRAAFAKWKDKAKIAFWINAYNALTLRAIVDHYPIKARPVRGAVYPKRSIRQIPGVWDKLRFTVMGRQLTLNQIEHEILRKAFNEPRIHMALVCAARSCPALRTEPYTGNRLGAQLALQTRQFLARPSSFRIDASAKKVHLSQIFKWFGGDFLKTYGADKRFADRAKPANAVLAFISRHVGQAEQQALADKSYSLSYTDYDWTLNEQEK